jgi:hypothetical protein
MTTGRINQVTIPSKSARSNEEGVTPPRSTDAGVSFTDERRSEKERPIWR